jgi:hypothetical protein
LPSTDSDIDLDSDTDLGSDIDIGSDSDPPAAKIDKPLGPCARRQLLLFECLFSQTCRPEAS